MSSEKKSGEDRSVSRRDFLATSAAAGAGLALAGVGRSAFAQGAGAKGKKNVDDVHVGIIGVGGQGQVLMESCMRVPGIRFKAVCDIWSYSRKRAKGFLESYGHQVNIYEDYREMLDQEKGNLDAMIVATPDWMHAEHANACMNAGLHVYCEKEMSNSLEKARSMVETKRKTGKLLQIGHQRRSNPRYIHAIETLLKKQKIFGRVTHGFGQWNRSKKASEDIDYKKVVLPPEVLDKYGYASMRQFRNWRWYKKYSGGPIVDLGSHQIDIFSWVFGANPKSVIASGGLDFFQNRDWYDNVLTIFDYEYEYEGKRETGRAFYQVLTTTSHGGFVETFMGEHGALRISEVPPQGNVAVQEAFVQMDEDYDDVKKLWDETAAKGLLKPMKTPLRASETKDVMLDVRVTAELPGWPLPVELTKPAHQPHLENFFDAVRYGKPLNCPAEIGYETAVAVLTVNKAVETGKKIDFKTGDFHV